MKKRIVVITALALLACVFDACGKDNNKNGNVYV